MSGALGGAVEAALASPLGAPLAACVPGAAITAIVADARDAVALASALPVVLAALERAGVPRGRAFVLLGGDQATRDAAALALRAALGVPVLPAAAPLERDDELREAEVVLGVGSAAASPAVTAMDFGVAWSEAGGGWRAWAGEGTRAFDAGREALASRPGASLTLAGGDS